MKLIDIKKTQANINNTHGISNEMQADLMRGSAQFIIDLANELKQIPETAAIAIMYHQLFFLENSYLEYERELICCASLFVAAKVMYSKARVHDLCIQYFNLKNRELKRAPAMIKEDDKKAFL